MKKNNSQPTNNDYIVNYTKIKNNRIEFLNNNFSGKKHKKRKTPWYMLTSGRVYNFEQHSEKFGQCVDFYRVDSETKKLNKKNTINKKLKRAEFMEAMAQHKLAKWIKKHPAPCDERDLFKHEFLDPWKEERDKALERFRDTVVLIYDKTVVPYEKNTCQLVPIIKTSDNVYTYPNMDPYTIGYPLCNFANEKFIRKTTLVKIAKEVINKVNTSGYNCIGVQYKNKNKKIFELAA